MTRGAFPGEVDAGSPSGNATRRAIGGAEVAVVGGGLAGLAAATALARAGIGVLHLAPPGPPDRRTSALMRPSVEVLARAGIADPAGLGVPLTAIRIIDATQRLIRAPETLFEAADAGLDAFGWNFANTRLAEALRAAGAGLDTLATRDEKLAAMRRDGAGWRLTLDGGDEIAVALVVGADGKGSAVRKSAGIGVREHRFAQAALVADLTLGRPLGGTSVEWHFPRGPFTLVPAGEDRANLVWIDDAETLAPVREGGAAALAEAAEARTGGLFGCVTPVSPAVVFPLSTLSAARAGGDGVALVGEAAHAFPPIGAQGLNLGLRDVADLVAVLEAADRTAPGWAAEASARYAARRAPDLARTGTVVDALFRSLLSDLLPAQALRAGGLWALKALPGLRRQAFRLGMGGRG